MSGDIRDYNAGLTQDERKAQASRAGQASGKARRKRKQMREDLEVIMSTRVTDKKLLEKLNEETGGKGGRMTYQKAILISAASEAAWGDIEAARFIRDTLGEKPDQVVNLGGADKPIRLLDLRDFSEEEIRSMADKTD